MNKFKQKLISLMYGRYGVDELYYVLFALCVAITIANTFVRSAILYIIEILILFIMVYRSFSKKYAKRKRENELKKVEARIEELETRDKEIDETMVLPDICTNVAECTKLSREKAAIEEELEGLYEKWEELA